MFLLKFLQPQWISLRPVLSDPATLCKIFLSIDPTQDSLATTLEQKPTLFPYSKPTFQMIHSLITAFLHILQESKCPWMSPEDQKFPLDIIERGSSSFENCSFFFFYLICSGFLSSSGILTSDGSTPIRHPFYSSLVFISSHDASQLIV
jgi:hypothetical protein